MCGGGQKPMYVACTKYYSLEVTQVIFPVQWLLHGAGLGKKAGDLNLDNCHHAFVFLP